MKLLQFLLLMVLASNSLSPAHLFDAPDGIGSIGRAYSRLPRVQESDLMLEHPSARAEALFPDAVTSAESPDTARAADIHVVRFGAFLVPALRNRLTWRRRVMEEKVSRLTTTLKTSYEREQGKIQAQLNELERQKSTAQDAGNWLEETKLIGELTHLLEGQESFAHALYQAFLTAQSHATTQALLARNASLTKAYGQRDPQDVIDAIFTERGQDTLSAEIETLTTLKGSIETLLEEFSWCRGEWTGMFNREDADKVALLRSVERNIQEFKAQWLTRPDRDVRQALYKTYHSLSSDSRKLSRKINPLTDNIDEITSLIERMKAIDDEHERLRGVLGKAYDTFFNEYTGPEGSFEAEEQLLGELKKLDKSTPESQPKKPDTAKPVDPEDPAKKATNKTDHKKSSQKPDAETPRNTTAPKEGLSLPVKAGIATGSLTMVYALFTFRKWNGLSSEEKETYNNSFIRFMLGQKKVNNHVTVKV